MDNQKVFYDALVASLRASNSGISQNAPRLGTMGVGKRFMDIVKSVFSSIALSGLTKEQFLAAVSAAFDAVLTPTLGPMAVFLKPLVMMLAAKFYDNNVNKV
jgi:hypothetical protein